MGRAVGRAVFALRFFRLAITSKQSDTENRQMEPAFGQPRHGIRDCDVDEDPGEGSWEEGRGERRFDL